MPVLINQRWPREIRPETCVFGRSRNDVEQLSPRSRQRSVIRRGRPLWRAKCSWTLPNTDRLALLRYYLDALDGFYGSVQIWNFASPYPEGLGLATSEAESPRVFWTYLGNRAPWTWAGMPSHWQPGSTAVLGAQAVAGVTTVTVFGLQPSVIAAVAGQYIQIGRRLYVVANTVMGDGGGGAFIDLTTPVLTTLGAGTTVRLVEAACEMQLAEQEWDESARAGEGMISVSASFVESVTDVS